MLKYILLMLLPGSLYIVQDMQMSMGLYNRVCCTEGLEIRVPNFPQSNGRTDSIWICPQVPLLTLELILVSPICPPVNVIFVSKEADTWYLFSHESLNLRQIPTYCKNLYHKILIHFVMNLGLSESAFSSLAPWWYKTPAWQQLWELIKFLW